MSSSEDDVPLGHLRKPDKVPSSKKRPIQSDSDDDDDKPILKKKIKTESNGKAKPDKVPSSKIKREKSNGSDKPKKVKSQDQKAPANKPLKQMDKAEKISHAMQAYLWWNAPNPPKGCQWVQMEHAGVSFPEPYTPHGIKMLYDGQPVNLSPLEEEAATFFAAMDPEGMHLGNPKTAPIFIKNFFADFKALLSKHHGIKEFKKCDFEPIRQYLNEQKIIRKAITDDERQRNKDSRNTTMFKFGYSLVDGHLEKVGNYNMEPPGAFRGRGEHPKMGKLKQRVSPEQVMINLSECAPVPRCEVPGHAWGDLRHDPTVQWLCQWKENINNQVKYMQLAAQSSFKGKSDRSKYNKAAKLCGNIDKIRADYKKNLKSKSLEVRQIATAMWVIDRLALRVGGEKDTEEEADTVGCCSLRVEHLKFDPNQDGGDNREIELEFLGKDSMLFKQTIDFGSVLYTENNGMGEQVYENFKLFCKKKKPSDDVFSDLTPTVLNAHLKGIMEGLTAKVFRTYK
jgi:DNA topoisomerase-1